jgi:regulator of sigma E protease
MGILINILSVVIVLGFMILVHEWGHFAAAKLFGVRVDVFSLGFGKRLVGFRRGDTDYRLSALPFGGYVRMMGENPLEEGTGDPRELTSKPRWQRAIIMIAGPAMNILTAVVITVGLFLTGQPEAPFLSQTAQIGGVLPDSPAQKAGLRAGDVISKINNRTTVHWEDAIFELAIQPSNAHTVVTVLRQGQPLEFTVPESLGPDVGEGDLLGFPVESVILGTPAAGLPGEKAGLRAHDQVLAVDGQPVRNRVELVYAIRHSGGKTLSLSLRRDGKDMTIFVTPVDAGGAGSERHWQVGVPVGTSEVSRSLGLFASIQHGVELNIRLTRQIMSVLFGLFRGRVSLRQLGGPVAIAPELGQAARQGLADLLILSANISLNLGLINLLVPIPILDGGQLVVLAVEGLLRRNLNASLKQAYLYAGFALVVGVMLVVTYFDIVKLLPGH